MAVSFPYHFDGLGRTAIADDDRHVRDLIEQLLFTAPGERVNRPDFGSGVMQMVFAPNSEELAGAVQFLVQGGLQQWLGSLIAVESVDVTADDAALRIDIRYVNTRTRERRTETFTRRTAP
jgi:phage baseplate assembly protein W